MAGLTPKLPLALSSVDGTYQLIKTYKNMVKQNFKNLLLTSPGERMMDPFFGVGVRNFLFENDGQLLYSSIEAKIEEQVQIYMPFIVILNIIFVTPTMGGAAGMDNNFLAMEIEYAIGPLDTVDNLSITSPHN
jgi:phage baseplate assembly protein W